MMLSPSVFLGNNLVSIPKAASFWSLLLLSNKRNQGSVESDYYSMFRAQKAEMLENLTNFHAERFPVLFPYTRSHYFVFKVKCSLKSICKLQKTVFILSETSIHT